MKLHFLGTGSAFTMKGYQTNLMIEHNNKLLIIDVGGDIRFSLRDAGFSYKDISAVYISHLHADHAGGVEYIGFSTYFDPSCKEKIQFFGNGDLLRKGWDNTWKGGLESIQGKVISLESLFDVNMIRPNGKFIWEGIEFNIVQSIHIMNGYAIVPSYGLMVKHPDSGKVIYFTTDTQHAPFQITDFYKQADLVIHDCETTPYKSGVHANYMDLCTLDPVLKNKMILVHYNDNVLVPWDGTYRVSPEWQDKVHSDGFKFMADKGTSLNLDDGLTYQ